MIKIKTEFRISIAVMLLLLSGCATPHNFVVSGSGTPFYLAYNSEEVIRDQSKVATITSTNGLEIDGVNVEPKNMRSINYSFFKKQIVVADVLPGEHKVKVTADNSGNYIRMEPITYNFEAGRIYNIAIKLVSVFIEENTSQEVAQKIAANRNNAVFEKKK